MPEALLPFVTNLGVVELLDCGTCAGKASLPAWIGSLKCSLRSASRPDPLDDFCNNVRARKED